MSGTVYVEGIAVWSPRLPNWEMARAAFRGETPLSEAVALRPSPSVLAPTERRRAPDTVLIALEVAHAACQSANRSPKELPSIFASADGDLGINDYMCATLATTPNLISPTRFHHSVHNAAAGYWTIGTGCMAPHTAISAFRNTFGAALVEAFSQLAASAAPVLLVNYDIEARGPMRTIVESRSAYGVALVIGPTAGNRARAILDWKLVEDAVVPTTFDPTIAAAVEGADVASCLMLFQALAADAASTVIHSVGRQLFLQISVTPLAPHSVAES